MKEYHGIKVTPLFSLCDYNIKVNDVCWNKVKMTSSKWIACCHRTGDSAGRLSNYSATPVSNNNHHHHHHHHNNSSTPFNTFSGRRSKCSPSISSSDNSTNITNNNNSHHQNQSPSNSFSSSGYDWANHSQSSFSSSSIASSSSTFHPNNHKSSTPKQYSKYYDPPFPRGNDHLHHHGRSKDDSVLALSALSSSFIQLPPPSSSSSTTPQSIITLINPFEYLLINCETNTDTNCAQISPEQEIIAVSNEYWLAFYSIRDNHCLGTAQFPMKCSYWTWITGDTVAIITENFVYHWSLNQQNSLEYPKFALDEEIKSNQIVNYIVDTFLGSWCALTTLFVNDEGEIGGKIQIFSSSYKLSQCIEAHACVFVAYRFEGNAKESNLLVAINRERMDLWKLYIIELSTMSNCNLKSRPLKSQQLVLHALRRISADQIECPMQSSDEFDSTPFCDIPTNIACDNDLGLIFIVSKYGSLYICDLETGTPLYYDSISQWIDNTAIFSVSYDPKTTCLMAICRKGKVLVIKILLKQLLEHKTVKRMQTNVYERISEKIQRRKSSKNSNHSTNQIKPISPNGHHRKSNKINNNYNMRTVSIMVSNETDAIDETTTTPNTLMSKKNHRTTGGNKTTATCIEITEDLSGSFPSYDDDDADNDDEDSDVEEMTRL